MLEAVYELVFVDVSFGFRRGRGTHGALRALNLALYRGEVNWVLEADIVVLLRQRRPGRRWRCSESGWPTGRC